MARLLLAQISVSDLRKAQARSFGHAKRRSRVTAGLEENKPPPAVKRSVGLNSRMKASGKTGSDGGNNASGGGDGGVITLTDDAVGSATNVLNASPGAKGGPEEAEADPGNTGPLTLGDQTQRRKQAVASPPSVSSCSNLFLADACLRCRRVVLGHPLNTISCRCGGCAPVRNDAGKPRLAVEAADFARTAGIGAFRAAPVAGADEWYLLKCTGFGDQPKSAGGVGSNGPGPGGGRQRKRNGGVGAAAVLEVGGGENAGSRTISGRV